MSRIHVSNLSGTNIVAGQVVLIPGAYDIENTSEFRATWNDGTNMSIAADKSYHVATFGANPTVEEIGSNASRFEDFMLGFALIFMMGLTALGARWVGRVLGYGGGSNE